VWRLLTGRWGEPAVTDLPEARRRRLQEEHELQHVLSRRPAVEEAAERLRRAQREQDFTALVEETFMGRRS
jgi:uncharacterized membrane protein YfbV (UPF0208 family)